MKNISLVLVVFFTLVLAQNLLFRFYLDKDYIIANIYYSEVVEKNIANVAYIHVNNKPLAYRIDKSILSFIAATDVFGNYAFYEKLDGSVISASSNTIEGLFNQVVIDSLSAHFTRVSLSNLESAIANQITDRTNKPANVIITFGAILGLLSTLLITTILLFRKNINRVIQINLSMFLLFWLYSHILLQSELSTFLTASVFVSLFFWAFIICSYLIISIPEIKKSRKEQLFP